jgi:hypothetical protein
MLDILRAGIAVATIGLVSVPPAAAQTGPTPQAKAVTAPPGYRIVRGPLMPAPAGPLDSGGQVSCPTGTVAWGGGTAVQGVGGPTESINTSAPNGPTAWRGRVNNTGVETQVLTAFAICGQKPAGYKIVRTTGATTPDGNPVAIVGGASCPAGTSVIGGGVRVGTPLPSTVIRQSIAGSAKAWDAEIISTSTQLVQDTIAAICAA